jgi:hypothetical protein
MGEQMKQRRNRVSWLIVSEASTRSWRATARFRVTAVRASLFCLLATGLAACDKLESASQRSRPPRPATPERQAPLFERNVTIELDAPEGFSTTTRFQVGFFAGARIARMIDLPRDAARLSGSKVQLTVPLAPATRPDEAGSVELKVRVVSPKGTGEWSQSAGSVTLALVERPSRPSAAAAGGNRPRRSQARQLTAADIEKREPLKAALTELLDGMTVDEAVGSFARVQDLAAAIVLTRKLDLSFRDLCEAVRDSPRRSLAEGLKALAPSVDRTALRSATAEAKALLNDRPRGTDKPR